MYRLHCKAKGMTLANHSLQLTKIKGRMAPKTIKTRGKIIDQFSLLSVVFRRQSTTIFRM